MNNYENKHQMYKPDMQGRSQQRVWELSGRTVDICNPRQIQQSEKHRTRESY